MQIYNSLTKKKEEFIPREDKKVQMFVCGPTVYDYIHIGNARTFVFFDVVAKYLRHSGYDLAYIQNITDIEDRIIKRAGEKNQNPIEYAKTYEKIFLEDVKALGIDSVSEYPKASEFIPAIVKQVKTLIDKGHAYKIEGDGWYFDLSTDSEYGKLSGRTMEKSDDAVSRIDENPNKRNPGDFCLWKFSKPGEPSWPSEIGEGRPGWHIEDTAITESFFGPQYDIHGGGQDLMFPHHEAEIAQQESASGKKPFVKYWMHAGFLVNKEQKMSKSAGNFWTIREALEKFPTQALRFYFLSAYYRSPLDFSEKLISQFQAATNRITEFIAKLAKTHGTEYLDEVSEQITQAREKFKKAMDDDFNAPLAIASLFDFIRFANPLITKVNQEQVSKILNLLSDYDKILGIIPKESGIPDEVTEMAEKRDALRKENKWDEADKIRRDIEDRGYKIDDTSYGPLITKK